MSNNTDFNAEDQHRRKRSKLRWLLAGGLVVIGLIAALVFGSASSTPSKADASASSASSSPTATPPLTAAQIRAVIDSVTLKKNAVLYKCPVNLKDPKTGLLSINDYSELGTRSNSFAFNVPLQGDTAAAKFTDWESYNCTNELQGVTYAWVLANTPVYGTMVGNILGNEFLHSLIGIKESDLRKYMMDTFHPVLASNPGPNDVQQYVTGTLAYETFISSVNTLYEQLYVIDDAAHISYISWEVSGPSLGYPDVVKSSVGDTLPGVTLGVLQKNVCQPVAVIMINDQDQRPERAKLPGCVTPTPTTPPTSPPVKTCPPGQVFSTTPGYTDVCVFPKDINAQPAPIKHVVPLPVKGSGSNTPSPSPSSPLNPTVTPGAPVKIPAPASTPAPIPSSPVVSDPSVTGPTPAPTPIANPD